MAFVLTCPFGANSSDVLGKPIAEGRLNLGTIGSSIVFASILIIFVAWITIEEKRVVEGKLHSGPLPSACKREHIEPEPAEHHG